jgi:hypothetical protein
MQRGCIAIGVLKCDNCNQNIEHGERYLLIENDDDEEKKIRYCVNCCMEKNYANYIIEKGENILTFFAEGTESS